MRPHPFLKRACSPIKIRRTLRYQTSLKRFEDRGDHTFWNWFSKDFSNRMFIERILLREITIISINLIAHLIHSVKRGRGYNTYNPILVITCRPMRTGRRFRPGKRG